MTKNRIRMLVPLLCGLLAFGGVAVGAQDASLAFDAAVQEDCLELVPEVAGISGMTDDGSRVTLDVRVLLEVEDGAHIARLIADDQTRAVGEARLAEWVEKAEDVLARAAEAYLPLDVDVEWSYELLDSLASDGSARPPTTSMPEAMERAKQQYGGQVPEGIDVVYVLSDAEHPGFVAGQADCIGGVRYPSRAFAAGMAYYDREASGIAGVDVISGDTGAMIAAHEIGHLMGGHHHVANCAEGVVPGIGEGLLNTCTLMVNDIGLATLAFSAVNGAVVRGHAVEFADG